MQHIPDIESIFNPRHLDEDCGYIAVLLHEYESIISECSLTRHFVEDEHYTYFDDMYSPEYVCQGIIEKMDRKAEEGLFPVEEMIRLRNGLEKVKETEAYRDYGALMFALRCFKH